MSDDEDGDELQMDEDLCLHQKIIMKIKTAYVICTLYIVTTYIFALSR